jgi:hypothetical protein
LPIHQSLKYYLKKLTIPWVWIWALILSILLHVIVLNGLQLSWPDFDFDSHTIEAELVSPVKPFKPAASKHQTKPKATQPKKPGDVTSSKAGNHSTDADSQPNVSVEDTLDRDYQFAEEVVLPPPTFVEIGFDIRRIGFGSGKAYMRYQAEPEGRYSIRSEAEAMGLASLAFSGKRLESSKGEVTSQGLKPQAYRFEISGKPERTQLANFNWEAKQLSIKNAKAEKVLDLPEGTQDFLSFLFQFMFVPPLDRMQYPLTNGKSLNTYDYLFVGEDEIETKVGKLNAVHIAKSSGEMDEKTEVWLATDYRFIPIKILKIAKDGSGFELVATRIDTDIAK